MLNEIREYEEYTNKELLIDRKLDSEPDSEPSRLRDENLKDSLSGIVRAYEIIARHFFFSEDMPESLEEKVKCTKQALFAWSGYAYCERCKFSDCKCKIKEEIDSIFALLPMRIRLLNNGKADSLLKKLDDAYDSFKHPDIYDFDSKIKSEYLNVKTADRAIANAVNAGPLRERMLVADKIAFEQFNTKGLRRDVLNNIYKIAAACLINKTENQSYSLINQGELLNWFGTGKIRNNQSVAKCFDRDYPMGENKIVKFRPKKLVEDVGFFIIDAGEKEKYIEEGYVVLEDNGCTPMTVCE